MYSCGCLNNQTYDARIQTNPESHLEGRAACHPWGGGAFRRRASTNYTATVEIVHVEYMLWGRVCMKYVKVIDLALLQ